MLKYRVLYCFILAAAVLFYLFFEGYLSFITLILTVLLPIVSLLCTTAAWSRVRVQLNGILPIAEKGSPAQFSVQVSNTSIFPIAHAMLALDCRNALCGQKKKAVLHLPVGARSNTEIQREIVSQYCGKLTIQVTGIKIYDYFGIFAFPQKTNLQTDIYVLPQNVQIDTEMDSHTNYSVESDTYSKFKSGDDPSEIFEIREFREGDRLRNVHWKLSSRLNKLMVKNFSLPLDNSILLLFDLFSTELARIDTLIETVVSVSQFLLNNEICHTMEWYDHPHEQFEEVTIEQSDHLSLLLNQVLATSTYDDQSNTLAFHNKLNENREYSHAIYVTTQMRKSELMEFCGNEKIHKTTILLITQEELSAEQKALKDSLNAMNVNVFLIEPGKLRESIDDLII